MGHNDFGRKLGRTSSHRKALLRNLATALVKQKEIKTTFHKAKELQRYFEKIISEGIKVKKENLPLVRLEKYFFESGDYIIRGRQKIKRFIDSILDKDEKAKYSSYFKDPSTAEKPSLIINYLSSKTEGRGPNAVRLLKLKGTVSRFMDEIVPRFIARGGGGYTRVFRMGNRKGDNAKLALISLTDSEEE
ncbi:bL17 family ribosomal protein [Candidatus Riflebacteria bacterium]